MGQVEAVYKCRYNHQGNRCQWTLTQDPNFAIAADQSIEIANMDDLHDWISATGQVFKGILHVKDGFCKWYEEYWIDKQGFEDSFCSYILI